MDAKQTATTEDAVVQEKQLETAASDKDTGSLTKHSNASKKSLSKEAGSDLKADGATVEAVTAEEPVQYRLYKARFAGLVALFLLNVVSAMAFSWFGPISNRMAEDFGITLDQVNWLGIVVSCIYLPTALFIPVIVSRWGIRRCCEIGGIALILASWIRYAGTVTSLPPKGAYALLFFGQVFAAIAQPIYQVLGPKYSETWFDLNGRTTATMVVAISNPIGGALGQLISPLVGDTRRSILVLGILGTAVTPFILLVGRAPPTPPTYAASKPPLSLSSLLKAMLGKPPSPQAAMSGRERLDFAIITLVFGSLVGASSSFAVLTAQLFEPHKYTPDQAGFFGACLLLTGIVGAIISAPLFDRVFTHHLALTTKVFVPVTAAGWFSLIWAIKPGNLAGLFVIMTIIGVSSVTMLPVALELSCEVTRNPDGSSAILWFTGNLLGIVFVLSQQALRAPLDADPPQHLRRGSIFNGAWVLAAACSVFFIRGLQTRKRLDEEKRREAEQRQGDNSELSPVSPA
ncbi:hypothetical protein CC1G_04493 [Coprinopsis cinerea okayama7|uniref:Major facilitator superfamily (MFS) profile domain-containing protein n=1 Tax=Coprinopsis cinerea (strain Okayama-7 / 130 / ATCC MYA-4618 / FGSC 9003) TaxID=240176 RepID=A8N5B5_COPC7|nr:hypothetical protein CC1G_04493 [Coprinopsis cinerea okayama7\|eukprot:XP_001830060.1 hypothetical protein CC1G_04493 [Coprinopsis cinerea okayama7\